MYSARKLLFLCYAAVLAMIGFFASDMYLPAFSHIQADLNTTTALVSLSVSVYLLGFAFAQLIYGPLSDQIGRKPALSIGLVIFIIATIGGYLVTDIHLFLAFRLLQALGICAAFVIWQPMIMDLFPNNEVHKILSVLVALFGLSPALAPLLGGLITDHMSWRIIFLVLLAVGLCLLFWTLFVFQESLPKEKRPPSFSWAALIINYQILITSRIFFGFTLMISLFAALYMVYIMLAPFLLTSIGYPAEKIGMTYFPIAITYMIGAYVGKQLTPHYGEIYCIRLGIMIAVLTSLFLYLCFIIFNFTQGWQVVVPFSIITFSNGLAIPACMSLLLKHFKPIAGTCASGFGFIKSFLAFILTAIGAVFIQREGIYDLSVHTLLTAFLLLACYFIVPKTLRAASVNTFS